MGGICSGTGHVVYFLYSTAGDFLCYILPVYLAYIVKLSIIIVQHVYQEHMSSCIYIYIYIYIYI